MSASVVLITGALTGIGRATALAFAQEGARIVVSGRRDEAGKTLTQELRSLGVEAEFSRADVRHEDEGRAPIDKTIPRFGRPDAARTKTATEAKPRPGTETEREGKQTT